MGLGDYASDSKSKNAFFNIVNYAPHYENDFESKMNTINVNGFLALKTFWFSFSYGYFAKMNPQLIGIEKFFLFAIKCFN